DKVSKYNETMKNDLLLNTKSNKVDFERFTNEQAGYVQYRTAEIAKQIQAELPLGKVLIKG
ncbi:MAG: hypothetical protein IKA59_00665, partial [Clostridia bacterium]|nr:hypothetical protein [Clostridia bacterium]